MAWGVYRNGNSVVKINLDDGTKIRETKDNYFDLSFPETIDVNIGNRCDGGCPFCYISATPNGINAELLNAKWVESLNPYTELAINGNSVDHPQLVAFLEKLKKRKIICNVTVNQIHFERKYDLIYQLVRDGLIKGLGISLRKPTHEFVEKVKKFPNAVIHTINGILTKEDVKMLKDNGLKILVLGYKSLGRGVQYIDHNDEEVAKNQKWLYDNLEYLVNHFKVVSFDNLAIDQLDVRRILTQEEWDSFFMGEEGTASMYIDMVTGKFGVSSLCSESEMFPITNDVTEMFSVVKSANH